MKRINSTKVIKTIMEAAPFVMIAVCAVLYFTMFRHIKAEQLLEYTPDNIFLAALVIIGMFSLKSLTFFFPMLAIVVACGGISPNLPTALLINTIGTFCMINIPYFIGRFAERDFVQRLIGKHKKMEQIQKLNMSNEVYFVFFLRIINCLPYDIVSMYAGASQIRWKNYVIGSMLGTLPGMICSTITGLAMDDPTSPAFIASLAINVVMSVFFGVKYLLYIRKRSKESA